MGKNWVWFTLVYNHRPYSSYWYRTSVFGHSIFFNVFLKAIKKAFRKRSAIQFEIQQILDSSDSDEDDALVYEDNSDMDKDYVEELNDNDESDMSSPDETSDNDENENLRTETKIDGHKQRKTQVFDNV